MRACRPSVDGRINLATGVVERVLPDPEVLADGIAVQDDRLVQLTYTEGRAIVYRLPALAVDGAHAYAGALRGLNDLECVSGKIYANALMHTDIYEISPASGEVERIIDCAEVLMRSGRYEFSHVLNGIAFSPERGMFWVTGKHWPTLFELAW